RKVYWAVVAGVPRPARGRVDLALAKLPGRRGERVAPSAGAGTKAAQFNDFPRFSAIPDGKERQLGSRGGPEGGFSMLRGNRRKTKVVK
ncbi:MAG: hypothetical protein IH994_07670, partial [Proteobacteria bacterium]|nr:hypothetical protein [Pseudomonadota bacterium]